MPVCHSVSQCVTVCCSVLQCVAVCLKRVRASKVEKCLYLYIVRLIRNVTHFMFKKNSHSTLRIAFLRLKSVRASKVEKCLCLYIVRLIKILKSQLYSDFLNRLSSALTSYDTRVFVNLNLKCVQTAR